MSLVSAVSRPETRSAAAVLLALASDTMSVRALAGEEAGILQGVPENGPEMIGRVRDAGGEGGAEVRHVEFQLDEVVLGVFFPLVEVADEGGGVTAV